MLCSCGYSYYCNCICVSVCFSSLCTAHYLPKTAQFIWHSLNALFHVCDTHIHVLCLKTSPNAHLLRWHSHPSVIYTRVQRTLYHSQYYFVDIHIHSMQHVQFCTYSVFPLSNSRIQRDCFDTLCIILCC